MNFRLLTLDQRRQHVDVQQTAESLRATEAELRLHYGGSMLWKSRNAREYLYRRRGKIDKSLGPRGDATESAYQAFTAGKTAALLRISALRQTLDAAAPVNRAMNLGRVPHTVARILRRLDAAGLLGNQVCVVGTNALFAYEAIAGLQFGTGLLATNDLDIALDARKNLALAGRMLPAGLIGVLRQVDDSFGLVNQGHYRAVNASGMLVDLITPEPRHQMEVAALRKRRLGGSPAPVTGNVTAAEVPRLELIVDAPRVTAIALDERGLPVAISAADPRWWAAHKLWLAAQDDREPVKRVRDRAQGIAVAGMLALQWANPNVSDAALASIPLSLRNALRSAIAAAEAGRATTEW